MVDAVAMGNVEVVGNAVSDAMDTPPASPARLSRVLKTPGAPIRKSRFCGFTRRPIAL